MKRDVVIILAVVLVAIAIGLFAIDLVYRYPSRVMKRPWPAGLGTIEEVPSHFVLRDEPTPAALALMKLTPDLGIDVTPQCPGENQEHEQYANVRDALEKYLDAQLARATARIDPPPPAIAAYLALHRPDLDAVRTHLLREEPVEWPVVFPMRSCYPDVGYLALTRVFVAGALAKARTDDAAAWDDLHALWMLSRGVRARPEVVSQQTALTMLRMMNAAAAKMPLPRPAWFGELRDLDVRRSLLAAYQAQMWVAFHYENAFLPFTAARNAERVRDDAAVMARDAECDVDVRSHDDWSWSLWARVSRFTAEREATEKILQLRAGQTPSSRSQCSDGTWIVRGTSLTFSRPIRVTNGIAFPLEYR